MATCTTAVIAVQACLIIFPAGRPGQAVQLSALPRHAGGGRVGAGNVQRKTKQKHAKRLGLNCAKSRTIATAAAANEELSFNVGPQQLCDLSPIGSLGGGLRLRVHGSLRQISDIGPVPAKPSDGDKAPTHLVTWLKRQPSQEDYRTLPVAYKSNCSGSEECNVGRLYCHTTEASDTWSEPVMLLEVWPPG